MLDVHPPHQATHSWKDFFIHIATIVVGLIIAVGLEQSVEAWRHHREAAELREQLHGESEQILFDAKRTDVALTYQLDWLTKRTEQVKGRVWDGQALPEADPQHTPYFASPDIPIWRAAKSAGEVELLTKREINAFAEIEYLQGHVETLGLDQSKKGYELRSFGRRFPRPGNGAPDFTKAGSEDLRNYLALLTESTDATVSYRLWVRNMIGAETAILAGKTKLEDLYTAERAAHPEIKTGAASDLQ